MRISRTDPVKRTSQPLDPRLSGTEKAQRYGYSAYHFQAITRGIARLETNLGRLFGPRWEAVKLNEVRFVEHDKRVEVVALERGSNLLIAADNISPATLVRRLDPYLAHEYAHALLFNRQIFRQSLSERELQRARVEFGHPGELELDRLSDLQLTLIFIAALEKGLDNPFVSGLQSDRLKVGSTFRWFMRQTGDCDLADFYDNRVSANCRELITEKVTELIMPRTGRNQRLVREILEENLRAFEENPKLDEAACLPYAILNRVHAEKTGNGDLLHYLARKKFSGSPYEEICGALAELWDKIGLRGR